MSGDQKTQALFQKIDSSSFFTWKKIFLLVLISQLSYVPCEIHTHDKEQVEEPSFMNLGDKKSPPRPKEADSSQDLAKLLQFSGWGGAPMLVSSGSHPSKGNPKDYYYLKVTAKASAKSISQKSTTQMMTSCQTSARINGMTQILHEFMDAVLLEQSPTERKGKVTYADPSLGVRYSCQYETSSKGVFSKNCEGQVKDYGVLICGPRNNSWAECECLSFVKITGGQSSLSSKITYE